MARSCEGTGRTVAEAVRNALLELGVSKDEAEITVLSRGGRRLFGLLPGAPARIRVTRRISTHQRAEDILSNLLRHMRFSFQLDVTEEKHAMIINIDTAAADGILIGKGGATLAALEYIVNRMLQREGRRGGRVILDVGGYKSSLDGSGQGQRGSEFDSDEEGQEAGGQEKQQPARPRTGSRSRGRGRRRRGRSRRPAGEKAHAGRQK